MKKILVGVLIYIFLTFLFLPYNIGASDSELISSEERCEIMFSSYAVNYRLKSLSGWIRVCNNNKLDMYITGDPTESKSKIAYKLCKCINVLKEDMGDATRELGMKSDISLRREK